MASIRSFRACVKEVKDRKGTSAASKVKGCKTTWRSLKWNHRVVQTGERPGGEKNPFFLVGVKVKTPKKSGIFEELKLIFWGDLEVRSGREEFEGNPGLDGCDAA